MARVRRYKMSRHIGKPVWGEGNDPVNKRKSPPGMHVGTGYKRTSQYGRQLREKQLIKTYHGFMREKQFRRFFALAEKKRGDTGARFFSILNSRFDSIVYHAGFTPTIFSAKQLIGHAHFLVNGKPCNIKSRIMKIGDKISIKESSANLPIFVETLAKNKNRVVDYLKLDFSSRVIEVVRLPELSEIPYPLPVNPNVIIEFYSR